MPRAVNFYIYYRVLPGQEVRCRAAVAAMQAELGVPRRLLQRADDGATWMEVYEDVDETFAGRLEAATVRHGLASLVAPGGRHVERFVPCA